MKRPNVTVSNAFLVFVAALYFLDDSGLLSAIIPAVALHELSHFLALRCMGAVPNRLSIRMSGLCMDYYGSLSEGQEALAALAGPAGGLLGALICSGVGTALESQFWTCCAGIGFLLSVFNLLPALPLDGGRALFYLTVKRYGTVQAARILNSFSVAVSMSLAFVGFVLLFRGYGIAVLAAGFWVLVLGVDAPCKTSKTGIK